MDTRLTGTVRQYLSNRGFGFIAERKNLHFFHITSCKDFIPEVGQRVTFVVAAGRKGPAAAEIELVEVR